MSPRPAAPHDAPRAPIHRLRLIALTVPALAALAVGLPTVAQASHGNSASPGKSGDHKPVGAGSGRRVR
jgi:hypothetical protein